MLQTQLQSGCHQLGLSLQDPQLARFLAYIALLAKWNKAYALTTITAPAEMVTHHLLDSLSIAPHLGAARTILDVGSGGGTPGIPLAIACPERHFTLLDSNQKKTTFLNQAKIELGLTNLTVVHARVETHRGQYDRITSRAFASLADFWAGAQHLLAPGGSFAAMKGIRPDEEIAALSLNCHIESVTRLHVPGLGAERHLVTFAPQSTQSAMPAWVTQLPTALQTQGDAQLWRSIEALHATPPRAYHSWQHIQACLNAANTFTFDDPVSVYLAILFHDCIYIAGARDNEARSAETLQNTPFKAQISPTTGSRTTPRNALQASTEAEKATFFDALNRAVRMIHATANHSALPANASRDEKLMIDIDLGILATPPDVYNRYATQVHQEWVPAVVTAEQYQQGRAAFLRGMLTSKKIFHSKEFAASEEVARGNLARELDRL